MLSVNELELLAAIDIHLLEIFTKKHTNLVKNKLPLKN